MNSGQLESKAEKYAYDFHIRQNETGRSKSVYEVYIDGFNDGYNEGFKDCAKAWHDLRKDPKDLPDEGTYLVVWQNARGYRDTMIMRYEEDDEEELHWTDAEGDWWDDDVIAWREIPKFEEAAV